MSGERPIELPGLSAQRSGPRAAVCAGGHVLSWFVEPDLVAGRYCEKCGDPILVACPECNAPMPGDGEMLQWVPYHEHCSACGKAYPWKAGAIERTKRTLAEQAEAGKWNDAVAERARDLIDDIAADRASAVSVSAAIKWLEGRGCEGVTETILDAVAQIGSMPLKTALRPEFPGLF